MNEPLLTTKETCEFLKISPSTLYRYSRRGSLTSIKKGFGLRFQKEDLEKWLEQDKRKAIIVDNILKNALTNSIPVVIDEAEGGQKVARVKKSRHNYGYGSTYIRKTKKGHSRFYIDYYDRNRKRIQELVKNAKSWQEAHEALKSAVLKEHLKDDKDNKEKKIRFFEFSEMYLEIAKRKKRSWKTDQKFLKAQLIPFFGNTELSEITPEHVNKFIKKREKEGVKNSTINKHLQVLRSMINLSEEYGYKIDKNPVRPHHFTSEAENRRTRVLSYEEEKPLMKKAAPHLKPIIQCALQELMRQQEILRLQIDDVDFLNDEITIRAENNKTGKLDIIPIRDEIKPILKNLIEENSGRTHYVFNYLDPHTGEFRPVKSIQHSFSNACRRAGIKGLQFRDLRRTGATRLHDEGVDPLVIQRLLRHSSFKISEEVYIKSNLKMMKEALKKVDGKADKNIDNLENLLHPLLHGKERKKDKSTIALFSMN